MKLYELTESYQNFLDYASSHDDIDEQAISDTIEALEGAIEEKLCNTALVAKTLKAELKIVEEARKKLQQRESSLQNRIERIQEYIFINIKKTEMGKVKSPLVSIWTQESAPFVRIINEEEIDPSYEVVQEKRYDKKRILADMKKGEDVKGVELGRTEFLRIR